MPVAEGFGEKTGDELVHHARAWPCGSGRRLLQQEPVRVILWEVWIAVVTESVADESKIGIPIQHIARKVPFVQTLGVAAVRQAHRRRIVILDQANIAMAARCLPPP